MTNVLLKLQRRRGYVLNLYSFHRSLCNAGMAFQYQQISQRKGETYSEMSVKNCLPRSRHIRERLMRSGLPTLTITCSESCWSYTTRGPPLILELISLRHSNTSRRHSYRDADTLLKIPEPASVVKTFLSILLLVNFNQTLCSMIASVFSCDVDQPE